MSCDAIKKHNIRTISKLKFEAVGLFQNGRQINEPDWACAKEQARWPGVPSLYCFQAPFF